MNGRIFLTGDLHGNIDIQKLNSKLFALGLELTKDDYLIILGDCGLVWDLDENNAEEQYWIKWLNNKPWTTLFVDGNHENFNRLKDYPVEEWNGGKIHKIASSIYHLMRGQVFNLYGKKFFTFGGAISIDRGFRKENISWWRDELPTVEEYNYAIQKAQEIKEVDYILTHTCPYHLFNCDDFRFAQYEINIPATYGDNYINIHYAIEDICKILDYKKIFFGHYHINQDFVDYKAQCIYNNIYELKEDSLIRVN